eukprot:SAG25_NODE_1567_length_2759_cov_220.487970_1_plen_98_part_00
MHHEHALDLVLESGQLGGRRSQPAACVLLLLLILAASGCWVAPRAQICLQRGAQSARCNEGHLICTPFGADSGTSFFARLNINTIDAEFGHLRFSCT